MQRVGLAVLLAGLFAGCTAPPPQQAEPGPDFRFDLAPEDLGPGVWAFPHPGGRLEVAPGSKGDLSGFLVAANDVRLATLSLPNETSRQMFDDVAGGELVLVVESMNGTPVFTSGGQSVAAFRSVRVVTERFMVAEARDTTMILPSAETPIQTTPVSVHGLPLSMQAWVDGNSDNVEVKVRGSGGLVFEARGGAFDLATPFSGQTVVPLVGSFYGVNLHDGDLSAESSFDALDGAVVVQITHYERVGRLQENATVAPTGSFRYGDLRSVPVRFTVAPTATQLFFEAKSTNATVALFDPDDHRIATLVIPPLQTVAYPVTGGEYVAALLSGEATMGSDVAPSPFDLHPLDTFTTAVPESSASSDGRYRQARMDVEVEGTIYAVRRAESTTGPLGFLPCGDSAFTLRQAGVVVGSFTAEADEPGDLYLRDGTLELVYEDHGDPACGTPQLAVLSYNRA